MLSFGGKALLGLLVWGFLLWQIYWEFRNRHWPA